MGNGYGAPSLLSQAVSFICHVCRNNDMKRHHGITSLGEGIPDHRKLIVSRCLSALKQRRQSSLSNIRFKDRNEIHDEYNPSIIDRNDTLSFEKSDFLESAAYDLYDRLSRVRATDNDQAMSRSQSVDQSDDPMLRTILDPSWSSQGEFGAAKREEKEDEDEQLMLRILEALEQELQESYARDSLAMSYSNNISQEDPYHYLYDEEIVEYLPDNDAIICPLCRSKNMAYMQETNTCECHCQYPVARINITPYGDIQGFRQVLASIFDRFVFVARISP